MEPTHPDTQIDNRVDIDMDTDAVNWDASALKDASAALEEQNKLAEAQTPCQTLADDEGDEEDAPEIQNNALFGPDSSTVSGGSTNFMNMLSSKLQKEAEEDEECEVDEEMDEEETKRREDFGKMSSHFKGGHNK
mmetsp:Transcript_31659/g.31117  ORF Transcript_31659/g.31117 Transcript_31659/m.31117 type:complete len:135 (-) Transcript_31659:37-441(-)